MGYQESAEFRRSLSLSDTLVLPEVLGVLF
jgi:hypothetical protein